MQFPLLSVTFNVEKIGSTLLNNHTKLPQESIIRKRKLDSEMPIKRFIKNTINFILRPYGYTVVPIKTTFDYFLHTYSSYEEYAQVQVHWNKVKLNNVWADEATLKRVAEIVLDEFEDSKKYLAFAMVRAMVLNKIL